MLEIVFVLLMAPSPTDLDLETNAQAIYAFETAEGCTQTATQLNAELRSHFWCEARKGWTS